MVGKGVCQFCPTIRKKRAVIIQTKSINDDTITGYDCEYPNCYQSTCKLPIFFPIGKSLSKCQDKADIN